MLQKTIFISFFHFLASRNILTSEVFEALSANTNLNLVIFVPHYKKDFFIRHYGKNNVVVEGVDESIADTLAAKLFKWLTFCLLPTYTIQLREQERLHRKRSLNIYFKYAISRTLTKIFARSQCVHQLIRKLDAMFSPNHFLDRYIDHYHPQLIFVTDVFSEIEPLFIQGARRKKVTTIGMVRSWDNTTTKGLMRALPDKLITNNEIIKEEAITLHGLLPENIFVAGIPQFDLSLRHYHSDRKEFFNKIRVDPKKRLILFAPAGCFLSDTDWQICEILKEGLATGVLPADLHFLVRSHPGDPVFLEKFQTNEHFTVERPGTVFEKSPKVTEMVADDARHLTDSIFHSEIIILVNSTIGIDSLPFDKPQIMIEFDGWENKAYIESVKRYHDEDHMKKYLNTGAVTVVKTSKDLFWWINRYLENSKIHSSNRQKAMREQLGYLDGRSGKRIAEFIINEIPK